MMQPSVDVGEDEVGFAAIIGQFDSIINTASNEQKGMSSLLTTLLEDPVYFSYPKPGTNTINTSLQ